MDILVKLGINGSLLLAQIVNFAIVAGVLAYFVYRPLLRILDERRERIRKSMDDVVRIQHQVKELDELRQKRLIEADKEAGKILEKAKEQAEKMKHDILSAAHSEAGDILARGHQKIADDRRKVFEEAQKTLSTLIIRMTQKILEREFSAADQKRMVSLLEKEVSNKQ